MFLKDHDKTALIHQDTTISYHELLSRIHSYAAGYRIKKGDRVLLCAENRLEWIFAFYSIWRNNGIVVPLDPAALPMDIARIVKNSTPSLAICSPECAVKVRQAIQKSRSIMRILTFDDLSEKTSSDCLPLKGGDPGDTAIIMYTSGTTGEPKGVMLSFDNLAASIEGVASLGMLTAKDRLIGLLPFFHIFPLQGTVIAPLCIGSTVVIVTSLSSEDILSALQKHRVTMFLGVPKLYDLFHAGIMRRIRESLFARILFRVMKKINSVRLSAAVFSRVHKNFGGHVHSYLTGGAPMNETVASDLWALGFRIVEGYGLTETAPLVAFNPFKRIRLGSVGIPMEGTEVKIENGEILVRGRNVMKGYYRNPEATSNKIRGGWFHTGDLGRLDNGYLYVTGRIDEMIVLPNGKNIHPEEIEEQITGASPYIREAGVFARDGHLNAVICPDFAALEKDGVGNIAETIKWKIVDRYNSKAPGYKRILGLIISREELPRTRLGKIKRFMLQAYSDDGRKKSSAGREPSTPEYLTLKKFLDSLSDMETQPNHHLELDLGLDSLSRVELLAFLESTFGILLDENTLALNPTVEKLADYVSGHRTRIQESNIGWHEILKEIPPYTAPGGINLFWIIRAVAKPLFMLYFKFRCKGLENLPDAPFILSPNHQSILDVIFISIALPAKVLKNTFFIARDSLARSAVLRSLMRQANVIFINFEKNIKGSLQTAASILKSGRNLVIFPEGHRTRTGKTAPFKKTFTILSSELQVPVVPAAIRGAFEALPKSRVIPKPHEIELTFCKPVKVRGNNYQATAEQIQSIIAGIVEESSGIKAS